MSNPIEQRIAEIKERCEKATEGPWEFDRVSWEDGSFTWERNNKHGLMVINEKCFKKLMHAKFDADFIAASRTDIPWLISELERTREALGVAVERLTWLAQGKEPGHYNVLDGSNQTLAEIDKILGSGNKTEAVK